MSPRTSPSDDRRRVLRSFLPARIAVGRHNHEPTVVSVLSGSRGESRLEGHTVGHVTLAGQRHIVSNRPPWPVAIVTR